MIHRFYLASPDVRQGILTIEESRVVFQMGKVLRMKMGSSFAFFGPDQKEFTATVLTIDRRQVTAQVMEPVSRDTEPALKVSLYQAIPKKPALFEWVVQKATELGVSEIFPLVTERTERHRLFKFDRLQSIAVEAVEQCGRLCVPLLRHPVDLDAALKQSKNGYIAYEFEDQKGLADFGSSLFSSGEVQIFIGPEGGLSEREIETVKKSGVRSFSLGKRILRTETAAIASLALLLCGGAGKFSREG